MIPFFIEIRLIVDILDISHLWFWAKMGLKIAQKSQEKLRKVRKSSKMRRNDQKMRTFCPQKLP